MSHTIYKTFFVKCLLVKQFIQICSYFFFICIIFNMLLNIIHHIHNHKISATMFLSF